MKFKDLRMLSNARYYELEIYSRDDGSRREVRLDVENKMHGGQFAEFAHAEVVRFQPIINDNGFPALEVELNV